MNKARIQTALQASWQLWRERRGSRLAAALAYYALFAVAPLAILLVSVVGLIWGQQAAEGELFAQLSRFVDPQIAQLIQDLVQAVRSSRSGWIATTIGSVIFVVSSINLVEQLRAALLSVRGIHWMPDNWRMNLRRQLVNSMLILTLGGLLVLALSLGFLNSLASQQQWFDWLPGNSPGSWALLNPFFSLLAMYILVVAVWGMLSGPYRQPGKYLIWGGGITALLLFVANNLIMFYLTRGSVTSVFGAAGTLVAVMLWIYYAAQLFLFTTLFWDQIEKFSPNRHEKAKSSV